MKPLDSDKKAAKSGADAFNENGFFTPNDKIDFSKVKVEPLFEESVDFDTFSKQSKTFRYEKGVGRSFLRPTYARFTPGIPMCSF